jgi:hypothetical protein
MSAWPLFLALICAPLAGCGALTAGQISRDAMQSCPVTRELQFDATLLASRVRVACFSAPDRLPRPPGSTE